MPRVPEGGAVQKAVGVAMLGALALGIAIGFGLGRGTAPHPRADVGMPVKPGPGENPRLAAKKVPGGTLYFVEGQAGLAFVPDPPPR
jgi:hypothetical protein